MKFSSLWDFLQHAALGFQFQHLKVVSEGKHPRYGLILQNRYVDIKSEHKDRRNRKKQTHEGEWEGGKGLSRK
jgi:hypothetical protein